jgi:hypothetical protein
VELATTTMMELMTTDTAGTAGTTGTGKIEGSIDLLLTALRRATAERQLAEYGPDACLIVRPRTDRARSRHAARHHPDRRLQRIALRLYKFGWGPVSRPGCAVGRARPLHISTSHFFPVTHRRFFKPLPKKIICKKFHGQRDNRERTQL